MHRWYPIKVQYLGQLTVTPEKFITEKCLNGQQWWEYIENYCPWHVQEKIDKKYWLKETNQLGKGKAHKIKKNQW